MIAKPKPKAQRLIELAIKIAPSERRYWFDAMAAEFGHVPEADRTHFAAGCLFAACRERFCSPQLLQLVARSLLIGGALLWAALNIRFAGRMSVSHSSMLEAYGYCMALVFLIGALATARFGHRATIGLAAPMFTVMTLAAAFVRLGEAPTPTTTLCFALIVENLAVLVLGLLVAGAAAYFASARKAVS